LKSQALRWLNKVHIIINIIFNYENYYFEYNYHIFLLFSGGFPSKDWLDHRSLMRKSYSYSEIMNRLTRFFILFLIAYSFFAQPGMPPCWLMRHPCEIHPHFNKFMEAMPHSHNYLFDMTQGQATVVVPLLLIPASLLFLLLFLVEIWRDLSQIHGWGAEWNNMVELPPPRLFQS
jgi:hypothetical protein